MAVVRPWRGKGIGTLHLEHCLNVAKQKQMQSLILHSNTKLATAIRMYRKYGFVEVALEPGLCERADIKMEKML
ncbi:MAG: ribosomal protein S18 acetylase RimI-like enzyme [Bacteroidia bacterium]|jgi:ribosomal protein S18 acetylase RimI-like enzyme